MTHTDTPSRNPRHVSRVADIGGSGVPIAAVDFRTYIVSRLITGVVLLFVLSVAVFILTHVVPEDPFLSDELGLDSPLGRYLDWVGDMSRGDFGYSVNSGTAVRDLIFERLSSTLSLLPPTMFLAAAVSIPVGVLAAARRGSLIDRVVEGAAVFGVGVPSFWLALLALMLILGLGMRVLGGPMNELVLPSLVLAIPAGAVMVRIIRSSIVEVQDSEDIEPPRGGGLPVGACLVRCLGNFLFWTPALFGGFLAGAIVVETVFAAPGIGQLAVYTAFSGDYPLLQGVAMTAAGMAVIVLGFGLVAGWLVRRLEPRVEGGPASRQATNTENTSPPLSSTRNVPWVPLVVIGILLVVALFAPIFATQEPFQVSIEDSLSPPGAGHLLGTDSLGRDVLSRLLYGTRSSLAVALLSLIPVAVIGGGLGLLSGYAGGRVDAIITGTIDNIPTFPLLLFAILVTAAFGPGLMSVVFAVTLVLWPRVALAARDEVAALKASGGFSLSIAFNPIIALLTLHFGLSILMEATLTFLGLGIQPPTPSWSRMMTQLDTHILLRDAPWIVIFAGLALAAVTVTMMASPFRWSKV